MTTGAFHRVLSHALVFAGYAGLAVVYCWPLPARLDTHITGSPGGDAGAYVWNLWVFRSELFGGNHWPFTTDKILSLTEPADLSLHNYTIFANLLSLALQDSLGLVATFNVVFLALRALSAYAMFALAFALFRSRPEAFLAGALFGFSPFLTARGTAHFSLVAAAPLPLFVLCLWRAAREGRLSWAVAAGATAGWAAYCDPYYLVFCVLMLGAALAHAAVELRWQRVVGPPRPRWRAAALTLAIACAASVWLAIALSGGFRFVVLGRGVSMKTVYTPALLLLCLLAVRLLIVCRPAFTRNPDFQPGAAIRQIGVGGATAALVISPLLLALALRILDGRFVSPPLPWRSSPPGVDLLAFLMPNPSHAMFGEAFQRWLARQRPDGFVENAASLTLIAVLVVLLALVRRVALPRAWAAFTLFFVLLSLGPFVWIGGFNTGLPTPWTLLRYVPGLGLVRSPTRFAIVAMLGFALLFAAALAGLRAQAPRLGRAMLFVVTLGLLFELAPLPRQLFAAEVPALYQSIAADECDVRVLELPFGLMDGTRSVGRFSARSQFHQTLHGKPLLGGYLSRMSERRVAAYRRFPMMNVLIGLSEDAQLAPEAVERARRAAPVFLKRSRVGYVVINRSRASRKLRRFAISALGLVRIEQQWPFELLVPSSSLCAAGAACAHSADRCSAREHHGVLSADASGGPSAVRSGGAELPSSER